MRNLSRTKIQAHSSKPVVIRKLFISYIFHEIFRILIMSEIKLFKKLKSTAKVVAGASILFVGINLYNGSDKFYEGIVMPTAQMLSAETAHEIAIFFCKYNLFPMSKTKDADLLKTTFFGHELSNPLGMAAGFDKQGEAVENLSKLGFGFVEVGSVTPKPQPGNPKPRVFRLLPDDAIINRYGFNSLGHIAVYNNLKAVKDKPSFNGVIGVNLGKNKSSENALDDYSQGVKLFSPIADYIVVNVSSPNTPGLRSLQNKKELQDLLIGLLKVRESLQPDQRKPILLKLAPDLTKEDIKDIVSVITNRNSKVDGLIISNTTIERNNLTDANIAKETGGLSGAPLRAKSTELIAEMYAQTKGEVPIIGVGGVFSGEDAFEKIEAGASFIQLYTAFALRGPPVVSKIKSDLKNILAAKGFESLKDAVGSNYKMYLANRK